MMFRIFVLLCLPMPVLAADFPKPTVPDEPVRKAYSAERAANYLDGASLEWTERYQCATCHTNVPYMLARPHIRGGDAQPMKEIRSFLEESVDSWDTKPPRADYNVLATAFALAGNDAATTGKLHPKTRKALDRIWTLQKADGSWKWPDCDWPPLEHDQFYGVAFVAVAVAIAPEEYWKSPKAKEGLKKIRIYLTNNPPPDLHHQTTLLWASTVVPDLLTKDQQLATINSLRKLQKADGSWCLPSLGTYHRKDAEKTLNDPTGPGDGYATGFVMYVLLQHGVKPDDPQIVKALQWLKSNQRESGRWFTRSLKVDKRHFITNAGSAFAVLALHAAGEKLDAGTPQK
ncbi:MAG: prenyltransferase/squalene oxidase repeat-containing protein [Zavarzinella sp.]